MGSGNLDIESSLCPMLCCRTARGVSSSLWNPRYELSQGPLAEMFGAWSGTPCPVGHRRRTQRSCSGQKAEQPRKPQQQLQQLLVPLASAGPFVLVRQRAVAAFSWIQGWEGELYRVGYGVGVPWSQDNSFRAEPLCPCSYPHYCSHCSTSSGKNTASSLVMCCPSKCKIFNLALPKGCFMTSAKLHYINIIKGLALFESVILSNKDVR